MMSLLLRTVVLLVLALGVNEAHGDILAGRFPIGGTPGDVVSVFDDSANGDVAPSALFGGATTTIGSINKLTYDPAERTLLMADFLGQQVLVFDRAARGDAAPMRRITSPFLGQPRVVVPITAHGEYAVINSDFIMYFASTANGISTILRSNAYQPGLIDNLGGLVYLPATDEVAVGDYENEAEVNTGEVLIFARTAAGTITPTRRIAGPATMLGEYVSSLAFDPVHNELFVLAAETIAGISSARILVFSANADGNVAPIRSIGGANTLMTNVAALSYYALRDELLVTANTYSSGTPRVLGFARTASGDVAPTRNIGGPASVGVSDGNGWYGVVGVPLEVSFTDGFE